MTDKQLKSKVIEMIRGDKKFILGLVDKAIASKCMDVAGAENNYRLPKNLLSAIYREMSRQYAPLSDNRIDKKNIDKIYNHL